jgi:predicted metalloprotease with PDZ domain
MGGSVYVTAVSRNSAAWIGGLNVNDELISVDGVPIETSLERMPAISSKKPGDVVKVQVNRDGIVRELQLIIKANPNRKFVATIQENATARQLKVRRKWMGI